MIILGEKLMINNEIERIKEITNEIEKLFPNNFNCKSKSFEITCSAAYFFPEVINPKSVYLKKYQMKYKLNKSLK